MKIILLDADEMGRIRNREWLEQRGHAVLASQIWPESLMMLVAEHEPDLVLVSVGANVLSMDYISTHDLFPDCLFRNFSTPAALADVMDEAERLHAERVFRLRPFADEQRVIAHDPAFKNYASPDKLHTAKPISGWERVAEAQEARFVMQLQCGLVGRHEAAKKYYRILRRFDRGLSRECAYRIPHDSYKVTWMREQIGCWLMVLAHYLPDFEIDHRPPPQNASSGVAYLHHEMPLVHAYPAVCVMLYGVRAPIADQIKKAITWRYEGQTDDQLAEDACWIYGISSYLAQVARAQVWSMDQFLDQGSDFYQSDPNTRSLRRTMGIYFETWGWHFLWGMGANLRQITSRVLTGETRVERRPGSLIVPGFREFREMASNKQTAP